MQSMLVYRVPGLDPLGFLQDEPAPASPEAPLLWGVSGTWVDPDNVGSTLCARLAVGLEVPALLMAARDGSHYGVALYREGVGFTTLEGEPWSFDPPVLAVIMPDTAAIGSSSFPLTVTGTGFQPGAQILFNNGAEVTRIVTLETHMNMETATTPGNYEVRVVNPDGQVSQPLIFTLTPGTAAEPETARRTRRST